VIIDNTVLSLEHPASETPCHPAETPRQPPMRGRSRERTPHRKRHRQARSEPRARTTHSESPLPRHRCKSPDVGDSASNNRHPSPSPPKVPPASSLTPWLGRGRHASAQTSLQIVASALVGSTPGERV
jgi:hypothetical protein